jgi:hypothetical protein
MFLQVKNDVNASREASVTNRKERKTASYNKAEGDLF